MNYTPEEKNLLRLAASVAVRGYTRTSNKSGRVSDVSAHSRGVRGSSLQVGDQVNTAFGEPKTVKSVVNGKVLFNDGTSGMATSVYKITGGPSSAPSEDLYELLAKLKNLPPIRENRANPLDMEAPDPLEEKNSPSEAILPVDSREDQKGKSDGRI